jgi:hypothetical protein
MLTYAERLRVGKNAGFVYIGQFSHDILAGLFDFITIKYLLVKVDVFRFYDIFFLFNFY